MTSSSSLTETNQMIGIQAKKTLQLQMTKHQNNTESTNVFLYKNDIKYNIIKETKHQTFNTIKSLCISAEKTVL